MAHIIVFGNEKGGSGKSTTCMHTATALVRSGLRVGVLDLDLRQRTFTRYLENRIDYGARHGVELPTPEVKGLPKVDRDDLAEGENPFDKSLSLAVAELDDAVDFIVIDCPGSHTRLSQVAHSLADTLVTPLNDSFVDFDLLARVDPSSLTISGPSVYSEMVWEARKLRAQVGMGNLDWVVVRNRTPLEDSSNKRRVGELLQQLSRRIGFRVSQGLSERPVFRELFLSGLTLLDLRESGAKLNMSHVAARQEMREMIAMLQIPEVNES